jgi:hypothetical protein
MAQTCAHPFEVIKAGEAAPGNGAQISFGRSRRCWSPVLNPVGTSLDTPNPLQRVKGPAGVNVELLD